MRSIERDSSVYCTILGCIYCLNTQTGPGRRRKDINKESMRKRGHRRAIQQHKKPGRRKTDKKRERKRS